MVVTFVKTRNYNNEQRTMCHSKQTQSNPIFLILMVGGVGGQPVFGEEGKIPEINEVILK